MSKLKDRINAYPGHIRPALDWLRRNYHTGTMRDVLTVLPREILPVDPWLCAEVYAVLPMFYLCLVAEQPPKFTIQPAGGKCRECGADLHF